MRSKPLDLRSVIGSLSRSNAKHPSPRSAQQESTLTEVIRRNRSNDTRRLGRTRCPQLAPAVRHESLMVVMPHDRQPRVAVATTPHRRSLHQVSCMKNDSPNPVQHGAHGLPACAYRPTRVRAKLRDSNIDLKISDLSIFKITWFSWLISWFPWFEPTGPRSVQASIPNPQVTLLAVITIRRHFHGWLYRR